MTKVAATVASALLAVSCAGMDGSGMEKYGREALELCTHEARSQAIDLPVTAADRAYVYARAEAAWLYFSHGDAGTSRERSADYNLLLVCGVRNGRPMKIVFLGQPFEDPVIDEPDRNYFTTPAGTTEIVFKRVNGGFEYCCTHPF